VTDLAATLAKAEAAGAKVLFTPYQTGKGKTSIVEFPGGYIAEIHDTAAHDAHATFATIASIAGALELHAGGECQRRGNGRPRCAGRG